ncbi:FecR family protein [Chitinophaga niastensis]|uniref:FecR family protein n=1 Tax=Chitinophaga niastensis TaxID=536980 RepID=A0A2P8HA61_CHINA|nr:FecR family protein [Chitinophaga niastensis]PSL43080.1 FecR family protein [Chitinophaga niastensis]
MTEERFLLLLELLKNNQLSQESWEELRNAISENNYDHLLEEDFFHLLSDGNKNKTNSWTPEIEQQMWKEILNRRKLQPVAAVRVKQLFPWLRTVAAAVLLLVITTGGWLYFKWRNTDAGLSPVKMAHIISGSNSVILTLGNGSKINLDSVANGTVFVQGDVKIVKSANGRLLYEITGTNNMREVYNNIETLKGGQCEVVLSDGSAIRLNSASSMHFPTAFTGKRNRLVALSGEGYFEVAKSKDQPFMVSAGKVTVEVLGTSFNVNAYADEATIKTTLMQGAVKVFYGTSGKLIKPGQQASLSAGENDLKITTANMNEVLAWKEGKFRFDGAGIGTIMRQIARWYDVKVKYEGNIPQNKFYGMLPRKSNVNQLLEILEETGNVHFRTAGDTIIVMPGRKTK